MAEQLYELTIYLRGQLVINELNVQMNKQQLFIEDQEINCFSLPTNYTCNILFCLQLKNNQTNHFIPHEQLDQDMKTSLQEQLETFIEYYVRYLFLICCKNYSKILELKKET